MYTLCNDADGYANDDNDERFYAEDDMLTKMRDTVQMVASTPRRLNFLCLVSFDRIPTLYHCNTKVSSGSQMVTAKEGEGELFLRRFLQHTAALVQDAEDAEDAEDDDDHAECAEDVQDTALVDANDGKEGRALGRGFSNRRFLNLGIAKIAKIGFLTTVGRW